MKIVKILEKITSTHKSKKTYIYIYIYFVFEYTKMFVISKELWEECNVEKTVDEYGIRWLNKKHIEKD